MSDKNEHEKIQILDHGYIQLVDRWGSDESIIEAARMSTQKGFEGWGPFKTNEECDECSGTGKQTYGFDGFPSVCRACDGDGKRRKAGDEKLLAYLWKNKHETPFEMAGITIEVQAPIFVFREWHRHRVPFGYNEASARYSPLPDLNYVPTFERVQDGAFRGKTKQSASLGDGQGRLLPREIDEWLESLESHYQVTESLYRHGLALGVPKELARVVLPVGRYSKMRATGNLRGWLGFLKLRMDDHAQYEIREYACGLHKILKSLHPRTMELFDESRR